MKFRVTFKTPDVVDEAINREVKRAAAVMPLEEVDEKVVIPMEEVLQKFLRYNELITVEFDTVVGTATAVQFQ